MRRTGAVLLLVAAALSACRGKAKPETAAEMPGMAGMPGMAAGGDTAGLGEREPVRLTPAQAQAIGVTYTVVQRGPLEREVRTVGQVVPAETRLADVTTKIDGFVEQLFVDQTGMQVHRGEPLLTIYSPPLVSAQEELLTAQQLAASVDSAQSPEAWRDAQQLVRAARKRLAYWDISAEQIDRLSRTGEITKTLTLSAPFDGVVLEKDVVAGQAITAGVKLYRLADLSRVWVEGDVFEQDLALIGMGASAKVEVTAYPGRSYTGRVTFVWPVVNEQTRTGRVRVELPNPDGTLKPGMFATLVFEGRLGADVLSVPAEAVVQTGVRNVVFVVASDGALEPRDVTIGGRAGGRLEIVSGLAAGQRIVASGNFLVDAESRLGGGEGMGSMPGMNMPGMKMEAPRERP